ncbi:MAG TPA: homoserine dehydrogenase [Cyclobacteriaceae bacterium]|jgi:homoserine dehydrogenase
MRKQLTLGLFGFGCVGQGLYHVLEESQGIKATIKKICVKNRNKKRPLPAELFTYEKNDVLNDPEIDVVVELIDDAVAAYEIVKAALQKGKHVVTANKKMIAEHLEEIYELQQKHQRSVLYEGAVCGSIPILRNLEEYYDNDLIKSIEGIFNGSTNYILTKVFEESKSYAQALKDAQELGFAESDPRLDVQGFDAKYKLVIAIAHTYGIFVKPEDIINIGIDRISDLDLNYAREQGLHIKLIARAFKIGNRIYGFVMPQFIDHEHPFASIRNEYNAVSVEGAFAERQLFVGKGAGSYPTGSAVLSDISALTYDYAYEYKRHHREHGIEFSNDLTVDVCVSFENGTPITIRDFVAFESGYAANGRENMIGRVRLETLRKWYELETVGIILSPGASFHPAEQTGDEVKTKYFAA